MTEPERWIVTRTVVQLDTEGRVHMELHATPSTETEHSPRVFWGVMTAEGADGLAVDLKEAVQEAFAMKAH